MAYMPFQPYMPRIDPRLLQMIMQMRQMQAQQQQQPPGGIPPAVKKKIGEYLGMGGAAGAGAGAASGFGAAGGGAFASQALPSFSFGAPSMMAPSLAPMVPGGAAAGAAGAGAGAGAATGGAAAAPTSGLGAMGWAGPAAFIASAPLWAPVVGKAGDKVGKAFGMDSDSNRWKYYGEERENIAKSPSSALKQQLPGFENLSPEQRMALLDQAQGNKSLMLPGQHGKDMRNEYLKVQKYLKSAYDSNDKKGLSFADGLKVGHTNLLDKPLDWKSNAPSDYKKKMEEFISNAKGMMSGGGSEAAPGAMQGVPYPMPRGPGTIGDIKGGGIMELGKNPGIMNMPLLPDPGFSSGGSFPWAKDMGMSGAPSGLFQPPQLPKRSSTSSPGIGLDGRRISYRR